MRYIGIGSILHKKKSISRDLIVGILTSSVTEKLVWLVYRNKKNDVIEETTLKIQTTLA